MKKTPKFYLRILCVAAFGDLSWWIRATSDRIIGFYLQNFAWKQLENLYFRDKKFSIEVHDAKR